METKHQQHTTHVHPVPSGNHSLQNTQEVKHANLRLAMSATFHCLIGCGIGEITGMIISTAIGLNNLHTIVLSVILGFIGGLLMGILPLKKYGFSLSKAIKTVIIAEGLSIAVMETFEVLTELAISGVMSAHLTDGIFWAGMAAALVAGFIAALPINYIMIKRGIRHAH